MPVGGAEYVCHLAELGGDSVRPGAGTSSGIDRTVDGSTPQAGASARWQMFRRRLAFIVWVMSETVWPRMPTPLFVGDADGGGVTGGFVLPTGTVTFLMTDIEGSTRAWERHPEALAVAVPRHYEILDEAITAHGGVRPVEQGEGDSVVAAFSRASDALRPR